nr:MAG TPA: hypothetical protein [Bacteriophage sp.]
MSAVQPTMILQNHNPAAFFCAILISVSDGGSI